MDNAKEDHRRWQFDRMPLVPLAVAFTLGLAISPSLPLDSRWLFVLIGGALFASAAWLWRDRRQLTTILLLGSLMTLGVLWGRGQSLPQTHLAHLDLPPTVMLEGVIVHEPERLGPDRTRLILNAERFHQEGTLRPVSGLFQVTLYGPPPPLSSGQRLQGEFRLHRPVGFLNPGGFDYPAHLAREEIFFVGSARADRVVPLTAAQPSWPIRVRSWINGEIARQLPPASAALLSGLLIGERTDLSQEMTSAFRRAGVYHILAVSGFNVALIAGAVFFILALLRVPKRVAAAAAIGVLIGFAIMVGGQPSVVRATIMGVLLLLSVMLGRAVNALNSLAAALLIILLWRPQDLWEPGFQLSFAATLGILALTGTFTGWLGSARFPRFLAASLAVSLSAQLFVTPIMIAHFHQLSFAGFVANLVVVPLAAIATTLGMGALCLSLISQSIAHWLFETLWLVLVSLRWAVSGFSRLPLAMIHLPAFSPLTTVGFYAVLASLPFLGKRLVRIAAGGLSVMVLVFVLWPWLAPSDGRLRVTMLDVGQGDAIFLSLPDGKTMLIDGGAGGGPRFDVGEHVVAPFLWERAVRALDVLVMTHTDLDHAGGLSAILRQIPVREFWENQNGGALLERMARLLEQSGTVRRTLQRGEMIWLGGVLVTVLNPGASPLYGSPRGPSSDENNNSLGLRLDWREVSMLFAADIEDEGERAMVHAPLPLSARVLKVGHHGSRFSTTPQFLGAVRPDVALISVGARNPFRHPAPDVLSRLQSIGATTFRTDRDGALLLESDGHTLTVTPWATRRAFRLAINRESMD